MVIFTSKKRPGVLALTRDHTGANLPAEDAPWHPIGGDVAHASDDLNGSLSDPVIAGLLRDGYFILDQK